jgi:C4-dicarboxylate transporter DctM subunit
MMVLIAVTNNLSVAALFLGGIMPGLIVVPLLMLLAYRHAKSGGADYAPTHRFQIREVARSFIAAVPALGLGVVISGGIFSGLFTPTEASAVAVIYTVLVGRFVFRELKWADIPQVTLQAGAISSAIMFLVGGATVFNWLMATEGVPDTVASWFQNNVDNPASFLILMNVLLMLFGMPMESFAIILLLSPIIIEIAISYGLNPVHIAVVFVFNCVIGMITPPFGGTLFVSAMVARRPISAVVRRVWPLWMVMTTVLLLITYVDDFVLYLPRWAGYVD